MKFLASNSFVIASLMPLMLAACGGGGGGGGGVTSSTLVTPIATSSVAMTSSVGGKSISTGASYTLSWRGTGDCTGTGPGFTGAVASSGAVTLAQFAPGQYSYSVSCGGVVSTGVTVSVLAPSAPDNTAPLVVDGGYDNTMHVNNLAYTTVKVCVPGTTTCQTIDHVMVDTGSVGLRLFASATPALSTMGAPATRDASGNPVGTCTVFPYAGRAWGSNLKMDVSLGAETAAGVSVQVIGDPSTTYNNEPVGCSSQNSAVLTAQQFNAKGIIGMNLSPFSGDTAFSCVNGSCTPLTANTANFLPNVAMNFDSDNNGFSMTFPPVDVMGASSLSGTMVFGIGTRANNQIGSATVYQANANSTVNMTINGQLSSGFLDSGTTVAAINDTALSFCFGGTTYYCPTTQGVATPVSIGIQGKDNLTSVTSVLNVAAPSNTASVAAANNSALGLGNTTILGLPFYYGRTVVHGYLNSVTPNTPASSYGFWAF